MLIWPLLLTPSVQTDAPRKVAGRTLSEFAADLDSPNVFVRLRAAKSLRAFGKPAVPSLAKALGDKHTGVQYWAASHLGDLGSAPKQSVAVLGKMKAGKNPATAMAAAYALCRIEKPEKHIKLLIARLEYPERGMACAAAEFLGRLGQDGRSAVPALEAAYHRNDKKPGAKNPGKADYHIRGASQNALRLILGEWEPTK
ncbi:MAG: HEAT repeat domain-containing protein [Planctomycetaceae bacterium]